MRKIHFSWLTWKVLYWRCSLFPRERSLNALTPGWEEVKHLIWNLFSSNDLETIRLYKKVCSTGTNKINLSFMGFYHFMHLQSDPNTSIMQNPTCMHWSIWWAYIANEDITSKDYEAWIIASWYEYRYKKTYTNTFTNTDTITGKNTNTNPNHEISPEWIM